MISEGLSHSSQKNSSGEVNISTAESLHLKNVSRQGTSPQYFPVKRSLPRLQLSQLDQVNISVPITQEESDVSNRLFTFMDEKEAERKIIQEYVSRQSFTKKGKKDQENKNCRSSIGLVQMIEDSRKKREDFFKKLTTNPIVVKDRSVSKFNKGGKSKTPRNAQNKFETLQSRNRSKTPKFEVKYSTPKHELEPRLFRAKSNLGKEKSKATELKQPREGRESIIPKKSLEEEFSNNRDNLNEKNLLKKKKELEKQLLAINGSLLELKKVENNRKKGNNGNKTLRNKSKSMLGRF